MNKKNINLKQIRDNQRLTQSEFGAILGVSRSTITKIEGGEVKLSKKMIEKLEKNFPKELGIPYDNSNIVGYDNESDFLINAIGVNLFRIEHVKELLKKMSSDTDHAYEDSKFLRNFLETSKRLNLDANNLIFSGDNVKYNYRFLNDFGIITKECLFSIYEDLYDFSTVKYLYKD